MGRFMGCQDTAPLCILRMAGGRRGKMCGESDVKVESASRGLLDGGFGLGTDVVPRYSNGIGHSAERGDHGDDDKAAKQCIFDRGKPAFVPNESGQDFWNRHISRLPNCITTLLCPMRS